MDFLFFLNNGKRSNRVVLSHPKTQNLSEGRRACTVRIESLCIKIFVMTTLKKMWTASTSGISTRRRNNNDLLSHYLRFKRILCILLLIIFIHRTSHTTSAKYPNGLLFVFKQIYVNSYYYIRHIIGLIPTSYYFY